MNPLERIDPCILIPHNKFTGLSVKLEVQRCFL